MTLETTQQPVVAALFGEAPEGHEEVLKRDAALARALKRLCAEAGVTLY